MDLIAAVIASIAVFITTSFQGFPPGFIKNPLKSDQSVQVPKATSKMETEVKHTPDPTHQATISPKPPVMTVTPSPTSSIQTYIHSPDADLGHMGFTVEGGQHTNTCSGGMCTLKVHGPFTITAYVINYGTGMAANVPYIWYDNDVVIKQGIIDHLAPKVETSIHMNFNSTSYSGLHKHRFVINPDKSLPEGTVAPNEGRNPWTVEPF